LNLFGFEAIGWGSKALVGDLGDYVEDSKRLAEGLTAVEPLLEVLIDDNSYLRVRLARSLRLSPNLTLMDELFRRLITRIGIPSPANEDLNRLILI
jgi:hypothetical protein